MKKIEIGCGKKKREGYECCDIRNIAGVDHVCEAHTLPFDSDSVDEVYSRHLVEHLSLKEFITTLSEWNRVLKCGGIVYIICPNLLWHLKQVLEGSHESFYTKERGKNDRYWGYGSLFGWQQDQYDSHKMGYYFELMRDILEQAGFEQVEDLTNTDASYEKAPFHLEVRATKKSNFTDPQAHPLFNHFAVTH